MDIEALDYGFRAINHSREIREINGISKIYLVHTVAALWDPLQLAGAKFEEGKGWFICRGDEVDLKAIEPYLPTIAQPLVRPYPVDLIPSTSWSASLANMLSVSAWGKIRDECILSAGACEECGALDRLECHEKWSYNETNGIQALNGFKALCRDCHETCHLGLASLKGRFERAFDRLAIINRLEKTELNSFLSKIKRKYYRRSDIEWVLDLSYLAGRSHDLRPQFEQIAPDVIWSESINGEREVSIIGVEIKPKLGMAKGLRFT